MDGDERYTIDDLFQAGWTETTGWIDRLEGKRVFRHPARRDLITVKGKEAVYQERESLGKEILSWAIAFLLFNLWDRRRDE